MNTMIIRRFSCLALISVMMLPLACNSIPENGKLPKDYSWAYGVWEIEDAQEEWEYHLNTTVLIGSDYLQFGTDADDLRRAVPDLGEYYPIYTFPKTPYYFVGEEEDFTNDPDADPYELMLGYYDCAGYPTRLYLNKKHKTVSKYDAASREKSRITNSCRKLKVKIDESVISAYNAKLESLPFYGDWKNVSRSRDKIKIEPGSSDYVLTKNGHLIDLPGKVYEYDASEDRITLYEYYDLVNEVRHYKRYDPVQERQDELTSLIANRTFSHMGEAIPFVNNSLGTYYALAFASNGTGISSFYNINQIMDYELKDRHVFSWRIDGEKLITTNLAGDNETDTFEIQSNIFGTALIDIAGHRFTIE